MKSGGYAIVVLCYSSSIKCCICKAGYEARANARQCYIELGMLIQSYGMSNTSVKHWEIKCAIEKCDKHTSSTSTQGFLIYLDRSSGSMYLTYA